MHAKKGYVDKSTETQAFKYIDTSSHPFLIFSVAQPLNAIYNISNQISFTTDSHKFRFCVNHIT